MARRWQVGDTDPPQDFFDVLYEQDEEYGEWDDENKDPEEDENLQDNEEPELETSLLEPIVNLEARPSLSSPSQPPYLPLTSPNRDDRDRSRSPLARVSSAAEDADVLAGPGYVSSLDTTYDPSICEGEYVVSNEGYLFRIPDAHPTYGEPNEVDVSGESQMMDVRDDEGGNRIGVAVRGRQGSRSGIRGRGQGRGRRGRGGRRRGMGERTPQWRVGDPLQIIWTHDDDVPAELREMAMNVLRRREARAQEMMDARIARERNAREVNARERDIITDDAEDRGDDLLAGVDPRFEWSSNMETFQKEEVPFTPERTGSVGEFSTAYDAFRSYWDDQILATIVEQTNLYASKITAHAFQQSWTPTNAHEILCLFAFWMMLGIIKMPTIKSCFSDAAVMKVDIFKKIFTKTRYENLVRALHFVEADPAMNSNASTSMSGVEAADRMHRLRPILDHLNAKFQANYILSKDISIDESLTLWKGWLNIKQYIRTKAAKFGIKTYELCEAATGYLWSFVVYTGAHSNPDLPHDPSMLKSTAVVRRLMTPLLNKGYRLFMDNWYNSPLLARWLKANATDCVGTLRPTRSDVPPIINLAQLKQGQLMARHSGDVCVTAWQDKKKIVTISTCHGAETGLSKVLSKPSTRPLPFKPQVVLDYNRSMGGVDLKDQMLEPYLLERKRCSKWYMKLFKRLLNSSILNARILLASSTQTPINHLVFRLSLVDSILKSHLHFCPSSRKTSTRCNVDPTRFTTNTHWPVHVPQNDANQNRQTRQRCFVCLKEGRKQQKTAYMCERCQVPLCIVNCFKSYHTSPNM